MRLYLRHIIVLTAIVLLLVGGVIPASAQGTGDSDGDGLPDRVDRCPSVPGPRENSGCPWPDTDGDGLIDQVDKCPDRAGPRENSGCPLDPAPAPPPQDTESDPPGESAPPQQPEQPPVEPTAVPVVLPDLPVDGPCLVATQGTDGVNVRQLPVSTAEIIGSLDPLQLYAALLQVQTEEGAWWMLAGGGFVADWVTREGGECGILTGLLLPAVQKVWWAGHIPSVGEWSDPHIWEWGDPHVQPFLAQFDADGNLKEGWAFGWTADGQAVLLPGDISGFDPQPEPPGEAVGFDPQPEPPGEAVGFDPQPDPPGEAVGFNPQPDPPHVMVFVPPGESEIQHQDLYRNVWVLGSDSMNSCDGSVKPADIMLGDGSVVPGDGSVMPVEFCDGSVKPSWLLPASEDEGTAAAGDGSVMPSWLLPAFGDGSVMPSWLLPAFGDGSVMPSWLLPASGGDGSAVVGDGSVKPSWLLPAVVFPGGSGKTLGCMIDPGAASPAAMCLFSDGDTLALCNVSPQGASCVYSQF